MTRGRPLDPAAVERAGAAWVVSVVLHDTAQGWLTLAAERWGVDGLAGGVTAVAVLVGGLGVAVAIRRAIRAHQPARAVGLVAWAAACVALTLTWTVTRAEVVHFGQYALLAALAGGGPRALGLAVALGLADEAYQWVAWYPGAGLDLRDVALDGVGAIGGAFGGALAGRLPDGLPDPARATRRAPPAPPPDPPGSAPAAPPG